MQAAGPVQAANTGQIMRTIGKILLGVLSLLASVAATSLPAAAQQQKPNILFIMGDDIGWMQPSIYHRGPNGW